MAAGAPDPRDRVTPTAFEIAPDLLGVRLASPGRRAAAFLLDLLLAGIVSAVGGGAAVGLAAAVLFVLVGMRSGSRHPALRFGRGMLVGVGALILFGVGVAVVEGPEGPGRIGSGYDPTQLETPPGAAALAEAERDLAEALGADVDLEEPGADVEPAPLSEEDQAAAVAGLRAYADALAAGDSAAADSLGPAATDAAAGADLRQRDARIRALRDRARRLRAERDALQEALDDPSFVGTARTLAADFGLTLGWIGVYFTLVLAVWRGYTPGKRLAGIRVVRLDGRPLTLWTAFERFGGYAAGLVTGLIGFAQVLWDPNRQGVQDKIAGTAVVRMADVDTPRRAA